MDVPVIVMDIALVLVVAGALAAVVRAAVGPSRADRLVAAELGFIAAVSALLLVALRLDEPILFDFALIAVLIGFLTTIGLARLVTRKQSDLSGESS
jgi:multicomponent Na+:H+ antiporter subunit F